MPKVLKRYLWTFIFLTVLLVPLTFQTSSQQLAEALKVRVGAGVPDGTDLDETEDLVLTELNRWRLTKNMMPFARNAQLDYLAESQAEYMMGRGWFYDGMDFHTDAYGGGIISRLSNDGWPAYNFVEQILGGENAAFYQTVGGVINFWKGSERHRDNVETVGFREIGIAAYAYRDNVLVYTVLAGRPNVLPVVVDAKHGWAFMAYDESYYSDGFRPTRVGFYNDKGERLHEQPWLVWSRRMNLPAGITENFVVLFTDGITTIRTDVHLPDAFLYPADPEGSNLANLLEYTPVPTLIPLQPIPTLEYLPTLPPRSDEYQITLMYDSDSFFAINTSPDPINLAPMSITSDGRSVNARFLAAYSPDPVTAIRSGGCLQAYSYAVEKTWPRAPKECTKTLSVRNGFRAGDRFWLVPTFEVYWNDEYLLTCYASDFVCSFDVPR